MASFPKSLHTTIFCFEEADFGSFESLMMLFLLNG
jgi:hypothetical protein